MPRRAGRTRQDCVLLPTGRVQEFLISHLFWVGGWSLDSTFPCTTSLGWVGGWSLGSTCQCTGSPEWGGWVVLEKKRSTMWDSNPRAPAVVYGARLRVTAGVFMIHQCGFLSNSIQTSQHARGRMANACSARAAPRAARRARAGACWLSVLKRRENGSHARADGGSMGPSTLDRENGGVQSSVRSRHFSRGRHCVPRSWQCLELDGPRVLVTPLAAGWD